MVDVINGLAEFIWLMAVGIVIAAVIAVAVNMKKK